MITHTQYMDTEGTQAVRKSGLMSARTAITLLIIFGLALSVAFPYGLGFVVFIALIVLTGAVYAAGYACYRLVKDMFSKGVSFGYAPAAAYMTGKKSKKRMNAETAVEKKKDI